MSNRVVLGETETFYTVRGRRVETMDEALVWARRFEGQPPVITRSNLDEDRQGYTIVAEFRDNGQGYAYCPPAE